MGSYQIAEYKPIFNNCILKLNVVEESVVNMSSEDPGLWPSAGGNDNNSEQQLINLIHQKMGLHSAQSMDITKGSHAPSYERRKPSYLFPESNSSNHTFGPLKYPQEGLNNSFVEKTCGSKVSNTLQDRFVNIGMDEEFRCSKSLERFPLGSNFGALVEQKQFFSGTNGIAHALLGDSNMIGKSYMENKCSEVMEGKQCGPISKVAVNRPYLVNQEGLSKLAGAAAIEHVELLVNADSRHTSTGSAVKNLSFYNYEVRPESTFTEEVANNRVSSSLSKEVDNYLPKRPPDSGGVVSSQEALSELASTKRKNPTSISTSNEMLKSNGSKGIDPPTQGSKKGNKKGKKGRQIDPALLGFKFSSNRVMMGDIQGLQN